MKRRIHKDLIIRWAITTNGVALPLQGRDLTLELRDPMGRTRTLGFVVVESNKIELRFRGTEQIHTGEYNFTLWEYYGKVGQTATDTCHALELVDTTCQEDDLRNGLDEELVILPDSNIEVGFHGASAYEVAVDNGFQGSEQEWLNSLRGADGQSAYQLWLAKGNVGSEEEFLHSLKGTDGLSAYEAWLKAGNVGSEEDFLHSLKGEQGLPGDDGVDGGIIYPKFRISRSMHLIACSAGPMDGRFSIKDGRLKLKV